MILAAMFPPLNTYPDNISMPHFILHIALAAGLEGGLGINLIVVLAIFTYFSGTFGNYVHIRSRLCTIGRDKRHLEPEFP